MQYSQDISQLFPYFLRTDPSHWVRFVPPPSLLAGYYHDIQVPADGALHRFLLHLTRSDSERSRVTLEVGEMPRGIGDHVFNASSTSTVLHLHPSRFDADESWPRLDDPFIDKAREIVISCRYRYTVHPAS